MDLLAARNTIDLFYGSPLDVVSSCLRGFLVAGPGKKLIAADFEAIESRVLNWLSGQEDVLDMYRTHGKIYEYNASRIFGVEMENVTKAQRQVGKVAELALGYQGGVGAFQTMAVNFGIHVSDEEAEKIKRGWREAHPFVTRYWQALQKVSLDAVLAPGQTFSAGPYGRLVKYKVQGSFLWCMLPSGRALCYPYPKVWQQIWATLLKGKKEIKKTFAAETEAEACAMAAAYAKAEGYELTNTSDGHDILTYMGMNSTTNKWERQYAYGGLLAENVTQAVARDLLAEGIVRCEAHGYPTVLHVHDENVSEVDEDFGSVEEFEKLMSEVPLWAAGLPVAAKGFCGKRYQK